MTMEAFETCLDALKELFGGDVQFSLATTANNVPSVRVVDVTFEQGSFYIVTYATTQKVVELKQNPDVALCQEMHRFSGRAFVTGHPLAPENREIREKLIRVFAPWYFLHNNEADENMCYVRVELTKGFFHKGGTGYKVDFAARQVETFPFDFDPAAEL